MTRVGRIARTLAGDGTAFLNELQYTELVQNVAKAVKMCTEQKR